MARPIWGRTALISALLTVFLGIIVGLPEFFYNSMLYAAAGNSHQRAHIFDRILVISFIFFIIVAVVLIIVRLANKKHASFESIHIWQVALLTLLGLGFGVSPVVEEASSLLWKFCHPPNYEFVLRLEDTPWDDVSEEDRLEAVEVMRQRLRRNGFFHDPVIQNDGSIVLQTSVKDNRKFPRLRNLLRKGYVGLYLEADQSNTAGKPYKMRFKSESKFLEIPPVLSGSFIQSAKPQYDLEFGVRHSALILLGPDFGERLYRITSENLDRAMAVVVDGEIVSFAIIQEPVGHVFQVSNSSQEEMLSLVWTIASGSLPQPVRILSERQLDAH